MAKSKRKPPAPELPELEPGEQTRDDWQTGLSPREQRIEEIAGKMMAGAWLSGVSDDALSKQWNLSPNTIRKMSAEASRLVRARLRDDPVAKAEARAIVLQTFEVIRAKAMSNGDSASLRVALDATRAYGFYFGIEPAKRLDVAERADPFEGWTPEEKLAFASSGARPRRSVARMAGMASEGNGHDDDGNGAAH